MRRNDAVCEAYAHSPERPLRSMGLYSHSASKRQPRPGASSQSLYISDYMGGILLSRAVLSFGLTLKCVSRSSSSRNSSTSGPRRIALRGPAPWVRTLRGQHDCAREGRTAGCRCEGRTAGCACEESPVLASWGQNRRFFAQTRPQSGHNSRFFGV